MPKACKGQNFCLDGLSAFYAKYSNSNKGRQIALKQHILYNFIHFIWIHQDVKTEEQKNCADASEISFAIPKFIVLLNSDFSFVYQKHLSKHRYPQNTSRYIMPARFYSCLHTPYIDHWICCKNIIAAYKIPFFLCPF